MARRAFDMLVLGIESSCDETGTALVRAPAEGVPVLLSDALHSQIALHGPYGGVVPELASRDHVRHAVPLIRLTLADAGCSLSDIDLVAYTRGPGLAGALLVGAGIASALAVALDRPAIGIHHLEGHLLSPFLDQRPGAVAPTFPFLALLVSGGHTQLYRVGGVGDYLLLGDTIDDAAGEAFDKVAKLLGLGYPGGAALAALAEHGDPTRYALPRPLLRRDNLDFSFAGLKTAAATAWRRLAAPSGQDRADLAASAQAAIVDVLVAKAVAAVDRAGVDALVVAGGVGANRRLRSHMDAACAERGWRVHYPPLAYCSDNGAMIAMAAAMRWQRGLGPSCHDRRHDTRYDGSFDGPYDGPYDGSYDVLPRWPLSQVTLAGLPADVITT